MCGIVGCWGEPAGNADTTAERVERMAASLRHRGPDDSGEWIDPEAGIALGFRRLSILDLSPTGHQPMLSADGRLVIVFNGEIYNFRDLRSDLEKLGDRFRGSSDTEVILAAWRRWGAEATLKRLWGMFALAVWDRDERTLTLARDRIGKKPLYLFRESRQLLFTSELKAILALPEVRPRLDPEALALYLRYGYVPAPHSILVGSEKLRPGHFLVLRDGVPSTSRPYWDVRALMSAQRPSADVTEEQAAEHLDRLLRDAVARRLVADVPVGALLSGGTDSSLVVALIQAQGSQPARTFTIGFHEKGFNEAEAAAVVARHLGTDHTELYVTPEDAREVIPRLPEIYDEPFADSSSIPTFLVCELARRQVTVSLSGDGGDELFGGYTRYLWAERIWKRLGRMPAAVRAPLSRALLTMPAAGWDAVYRGLEIFLPRSRRQSLGGDKLRKLAEISGSRTQDDLYRRLVSLWKEPAEIARRGVEPSLLQVEGVGALVPDFTERMMFLDLVTYLPDDILVKVDRASMAVSLEARCPLLDHRVVEWAWTLPLSWKRKDGEGKRILRQVLYRYVPRELVDRPKTGFGIPLDSWLRGPLRDWAESLLSRERLEREGVLAAAPVREAWDAHLSGRRNEQYRIWVILMFQAWKERWGV